MKFLSIASLLVLSIINGINAHTYESLGINAVKKQETEALISKEHTIPIINVSTKDNSELILSRDNYTDCVVDFFNVENKFKFSEKSAKIRVRGNYSGFYGDAEQIKNNTVPYKIKFDEKTSFYGLHNGEKFKSWTLLKTFDGVILNDIGLRIGRQIFGNEQYISDSKFVNLYVNDKFQGLYVLCEQNEVNEKRVNISKPEKNYNGTDIGYYFELDQYYYEKQGQFFRYLYEGATVTDLRGKERTFFKAEYTLKSDFYCQEQLDFIGHFTTSIFKIIYLAVEKGEFQTFDENYNLVNSTYTNAQDTISAVMDINTVVNMYLLYEIVHDNDVGEGSFYFAADFADKSKTPKLQMVSPWDFDWILTDGPRRYWAAAFVEDSFIQEYRDRSNPWFVLLGKEEWFHELVAKKWEAVSDLVKAQVPEQKAYIDENIDEFLKIANVIPEAMQNIENEHEWLLNRFEWMDEAFVPGRGIYPIPSEEIPAAETTTTEIEIPTTVYSTVTETSTIYIDDDDDDIAQEVEATVAVNEDDDSDSEYSDEEEQ
ncbi:hypothetical protein BCR36DRAFT_585342 [Piromyces finnis]|uniref:Coth-domain-containing protein n=1 Tax=Piromyces finnis TaxID=1754191 RepID=A0A1Y1V434_9FUNG|nr:hypothetical protein BCR36DRAFT_585342 [Piromyces finnis]|eukprot:ORX46205.1 hypothetical protein BCR36DRAFT_585342 [Piromyces finnis]